MQNNDEKINQIYSDMLKTADLSSDKGFTKESAEALKSIEERFDQLTLDENAPKIPENPTSSVKIDAINGETLMRTYNPDTGEVVTQDNSAEIAEKIAIRHLDNLLSGTDSVDNSVIIEVLKEMGTSNINNSDSVIASIIIRRMNGEKFSIYDEMPEDYKRQINMIYSDALQKAKMASRVPGVISKNTIATMMIDDMINDIKNSINSQVDLDTILSGFDQDVKKMQEEMSTELGGMMMSFDEERKAEIDAAIKRCEENGKTDAIEKLKAMKENIDEAFNLTKFIEFCKTCKIRNIEIKEPNKRVFNSFNAKYEKHKYIINDIRSCPGIMDRHMIGYTHIQNLALCEAFCKYCQNMSPDNMNEHTFMYYFIRNIIAIDLLNPKGRLYEGMDERSKTFYDLFIHNLKQATNNLIERNPNLIESEQPKD